jgi:hypothetical protein
MEYCRNKEKIMRKRKIKPQVFILKFVLENFKLFTTKLTVLSFLSFADMPALSFSVYNFLIFTISIEVFNS